MKYKQMTLRDAFHYLRSRRHIIGPNFGFIKQVGRRRSGVSPILSLAAVDHLRKIPLRLHVRFVRQHIVRFRARHLPHRAVVVAVTSATDQLDDHSHTHTNHESEVQQNAIAATGGQQIDDDQRDLLASPFVVSLFILASTLLESFGAPFNDQCATGSSSDHGREPHPRLQPCHHGQGSSPGELVVRLSAQESHHGTPGPRSSNHRSASA